MSTAHTAREAIFQRVRVAVRDVAVDEQPQDVVVERSYRRRGTALRQEVVELFS